MSRFHAWFCIYLVLLVQRQWCETDGFRMSRTNSFILRINQRERCAFQIFAGTSPPPFEPNRDLSAVPLVPSYTQSSIVPSAATPSSNSPPPQNFTQDLQLGFQQLQPFLKIAVPFFRNDVTARNSLLLVSILTFVNSGMSVIFSYISRDFYNALNTHNEPVFYEKIQLFFLALLIAVPLSVTYSFTLDKLSLYWREELTKTMLSKYYSNQMFYVIETLREIDNPDQRIAEDIRHFTKTSLGFFITVITSIVDLVCFSYVLYQIFPNLFIAIILYAVFGTIVTTQLGKSLVALSYQKLLTEADFRFQLFRVRENAESIAFYDRDLKEEQSFIQEIFQRVLKTTLEIIVVQRNVDTFTTSYRYIIQILPSLIIAPLYFQGKVELGVINQSYSAFNHILSDFSIVINSFESLSYFAAGLTRLSKFFERISNPGWGDIVTHTSRTINDADADDQSSTSPMTVNEVVSVPKPLLQFSIEELSPSNNLLQCKNLTVFTPDYKRVIIGNLTTSKSEDAEQKEQLRQGIKGIDFVLKKEDRLLIVGPSGSGKSSFVRTIAGLWQVGYGKVIWDQSMVSVPLLPSPLDSYSQMNESIVEESNITTTITAPKKVFFLPQKPYNLISSLRNQIIYPNIRNGSNDDETVADDVFIELLNKVQLSELAERIGNGNVREGLRTVKDWSRILSIGEQQRLAFARVLFNRPEVVVLDEATSALDLSLEAKMYELLMEMKVTYVSVGHRPSLLRFHAQRLVLGKEGEAPRLLPIQLSEINLTQELLDLTAA